MAEPRDVEADAAGRSATHGEGSTPPSSRGPEGGPRVRRSKTAPPDAPDDRTLEDRSPASVKVMPAPLIVLDPIASATPSLLSSRSVSSLSDTKVVESVVAIGTVVDGRYTVTAELGRGGMGVVYLARDAWLDRHVALKMIAPTWATDSDAAGRFQREAKALASIRSQYVVQVYAFGVHDGAYFFAMEYVPGRSLKQILAEHRRHGDTIPPTRILMILSKIALGIDAVHDAGIVHRDVKPSNIVIEEDTGRPVLVDFGLAVPSEDQASRRNVGSPQYMSPEQAGYGEPGAPLTDRADVYSLGVTAYEMLTGHLPFQSNDRSQLMRNHRSKTPPPVSRHKPGLGPFDRAVLRALAKDPIERYATCAAFVKALEAACETWASTPPPTLPPSAPPVAPPAAAKAPSMRPAARLRSERPAKQASTAAVTKSAVPVRVLVVDDSPVFRKFTVHAVKVAFFPYRKKRPVEVNGAGSGKEAIAIASDWPPDLVLLDFDMPGLDGLNTLSRLRALSGGHRASVVVLSGRVRGEDQYRFSLLGVFDFVKKPIDFPALVARLSRIARRFDQHRSSQDEDSTRSSETKRNEETPPKETPQGAP